MQLESDDLVVARPEGLYCPQGQFYIDPWKPVDRAIITHAHADHARTGHGRYLATTDSAEVLRSRLGAITLDALDYGQEVVHNGVRISLHPAGHVLGSAQVRLEWQGQVWVASGDYKTTSLPESAADVDATCAPMEAVRCDVFITESTFGLPIYHWQRQSDIYRDINTWWRRNVEARRCSVMYCYAFGKAQRILAGLDPSIGPIVCHGAVETLNAAYRRSGVVLPATLRVGDVTERAGFEQAIVLAPPSAAGTSWLKRFGEFSDAFASGWMLLRGARRRRALDAGFVLSDHADWPGLNAAIEATGAQRVIVTHGQIPVMVRWLRDRGLDAQSFETEYGDEDDGPADGAQDASTAESFAEPSAGATTRADVQEKR